MQAAKDLSACTDEFEDSSDASDATEDNSDLDLSQVDIMASTLAAAGSMSPSTSPRLPSPPPFPEVQLGPSSPSPGAQAAATTQDVDDAAKLDSGSTRRIRPGTKAADMASGPPLVPLSELDSPFQLQEHLKALYYHLTKLDANDTTIPISHATAVNIATPPENVDRSLWLYELCRLLVQKANNLLVAFFSDSPACSAQTCPEMRASEWQYLCAVHDPPKSCCAIDYCCHTLDWAANVLTSQKHFPSRLTLGSDASGGSLQGVKQLTNIFRRVYRIFAHAWFQHRQVFWQVEGNEGLYIFFKTVCDMYNLIPEDNYTVPPEAEGITSEKEYRGFDEGQYSETMSSSSQGSIIRPPKEGQATTEDPATVTSTMKTGATFDKQKEDSTNATTTTISTGATTRRHKHTPSLGSAVTTIAEGDEDESTGARSSAEADESEDLLPKQVTRSSTVVFSRDEPTQDEAPEPSEHVIEPPEKITDLEVDVDNAGNTEQRKEPDTAGKQNALQEENQGTEPAGSVNEKDDMSKEEA